MERKSYLFLLINNSCNLLRNDCFPIDFYFVIWSLNEIPKIRNTISRRANLPFWIKYRTTSLISSKAEKISKKIKLFCEEHRTIVINKPVSLRTNKVCLRAYSNRTNYNSVAIVNTWLEYILQSLELPTSAETRERLRCQLTNRKWQLIVPLASWISESRTQS